MYSFSVSMVRRRISEAQRWQIISMHTTRMSFKAIERQMGYHYTVVSWLVRKHTQTNNVIDLPRSNRPRVTSDRDDRALQRLVRQMPFATSPVLKQHWLPNRRLSTKTVRNRLKSAGLKSRRVIKRPLLADQHRRSCLAWCLASHEPGFESHIAYLGHVRPSYACSGTSCAKHLSVGSGIASGMAAANRTSDVQLEGWDEGLRPSSKHEGVTPGTELWTIHVVKWFISVVLKVKWQSYCAFWTVKVNA